MNLCSEQEVFFELPSNFYHYRVEGNEWLEMTVASKSCMTILYALTNRGIPPPPPHPHPIHTHTHELQSNLKEKDFLFFFFLLLQPLHMLSCYFRLWEPTVCLWWHGIPVSITCWVEEETSSSLQSNGNETEILTFKRFKKHIPTYFAINEP